MNLIDTHSHLYLPQFDEDRAEVMQRAAEKGVNTILLPNIDSTSIDGMMQMTIDYPGICIPMMGLHPCSVKDNYQEELQLAESLLDKHSFCAIGEIGIDLYWDRGHFEQQKDAFRIQCQWAKDRQLPIAIHVREAFDEIFELMDEIADERLKGVFHCFTGTVEQAQRVIGYGFKMGIGGVVTFRKAGLDTIVKEIDLKHLILETDSPYLTPTPYRGKRNESSYTFHVAEKLAEIFDLPLEEIARITTQNAVELFQLQKVNSPA